jgi:phenylpyruvate tautomerase PptA (4-oxalocrotonate tautomerase family)
LTSKYDVHNISFIFSKELRKATTTAVPSECSCVRRLRSSNFATVFLNEGHMPYLQLDVNEHYPTATKQLLAERLSRTYSSMMSVDIRRITVAIRELGEGGVWRITEQEGKPEPVAIMMLDIRKGRSPALRMETAKALCAHCVDILGLEETRLNVEFTQHSGDEMYHPSLGGYSPEWSSDEQ